jgi:hypothetical protein
MTMVKRNDCSASPSEKNPAASPNPWEKQKNALQLHPKEQAVTKEMELIESELELTRSQESTRS